MLIGVPKEIKNHEYRVGMTPASVKELTDRGHTVMIESTAGDGSGFSDQNYIDAGAKICPDAASVFAESEMIVKVKEPQACERAMLRENQILFTYLHLAPDAEQTKDLIDSKAICIAYETVTSDKKTLPLLAPMSEVAGRMAIQAAMTSLEKAHGGCGMLLGGVPGVEPAKVTVIGAGVVGCNAAQMAVGLGAEVVILDKNIDALREVDAIYQGRIKTVYSTADSIEKHTTSSEVVVGSVLLPGAEAPKLITHELVKKMKPGSVIVDVAIDQGGCAETSKATTHQEPTYIVDNVVHYCVANMPGGVARTSTFALNNATLPYIVALADKGYQEALLTDKHLLNGLNVCQGQITNQSVAESHGLTYVAPETALFA
ncbi:alanine dehydrogenase [Vibrio sp. CAU 1672]|uniref:alanine dehydrogenase n=1 Tax=Vibrio sp. CAU 1672 TaxID=3032594 RepID=UPI0023DB08B1|nr:alanine dehydrogenase [Vibrio sp. CAU 1672]MDF2155753.1 alanine dehydrogenase [Vibrio sp. CAU 1672]